MKFTESHNCAKFFKNPEFQKFLQKFDELLLNTTLLIIIAGHDNYFYIIYIITYAKILAEFL